MPKIITHINDTSAGQQKLLRQYFGYRSTKSVINNIGGVDFSNLDDKTKAKRAYAILAREYNTELFEDRKKRKLEYQKKFILKRKEKRIEEKKEKRRRLALIWSSTIQTIRFGKYPRKKTNEKSELNEHDVVYTNASNISSNKQDVRQDAMRHYVNFVKERLNSSKFDYFYTPNKKKFEIPKNIEEDNNFFDNVSKSFNIIQHIMVSNTAEPTQTKIKDAGAINLDTFMDNSIWDTSSNRCVPDWINYKYKNIKGFKKAVRDYESIQNISTIGMDTEDNEQMNPNEYGYTLSHIETFCFNMGIHLYALIDGQIRLYRNTCKDGVSLKKYPLVIEVKNNHLYPIIDEKRIQALKVTAQNMYQPSIKRISIFHNEEKKKQDSMELVFNKEHKAPFQFLIETMEKTNTMVYNSNIKIVNGYLSYFILNNKKYITDYDDNLAQYFGQEYIGQNVSALLSPYVENLPKSYMSNEIQTALQLHQKSYIKHRTHQDMNYDIDINDDNVRKFDINKCYRFVMENPVDDWMTTDFHSSVQVKNTYDGQFGLYFLCTEDTRLLHKSNWYSNKIIEKAKSEGIDFTIKYFINGYRQDKTLLKNVIDDISKTFQDKEILNDGKPVLYNPKKTLINALSGFMGKTKSRFSHVRVDTDQNRIWETYFKERQSENNKPYFYMNGKYVFYGETTENVLIENNLPMYIQILDQANILLFDKIKETGGICIGRKTDAFLVFKPQNVQLSEDNGGLKEEVKTGCFNVEHAHVEYEYEKPRINKIAIHDSSQYKDIIDITDNHKSVMLLGRAGTGKTFVLNKIKEYYGDGCVCLAFSNKACNNLNGMTIHKFLKMDAKGKLCQKTMKHITKHVNVIIIDELGMIPSDLWKHLEYIKQNCDVTFICAGCYRQLPPIENMTESADYFNHTTILNICDYNQVELNTVYRYDPELLEKSNDVYDGKITQFDVSWFDTNVIVHALQNICWSNKKRKCINKICNEYHADKASKKLVIDYDGQENKYNENIIIYKGCKLLSNINDTKKNIRKNESYIVNNFDSESINLTLLDAGEENELTITISELHKYFILGYCITTYKCQGDTYKGSIVIFESRKMFDDKRHIYTAMTRTNKFENITFM